MPKLTPDLCLPLWHRALESEFGLAVQSSDRKKLANTLYEARQRAADPELERLMLFQPNAPAENDVWIVKKEVELE